MPSESPEVGKPPRLEHLDPREDGREAVPGLEVPVPGLEVLVPGLEVPGLEVVGRSNMAKASGGAKRPGDESGRDS